METACGVTRMGARQGQPYLPKSLPISACSHDGPSDLSDLRAKKQGDCGGCKKQKKPHYQHPGRSFKPHFP